MVFFDCDATGFLRAICHVRADRPSRSGSGDNRRSLHRRMQRPPGTINHDTSELPEGLAHVAPVALSSVLDDNVEPLVAVSNRVCQGRLRELTRQPRLGRTPDRVNRALFDAGARHSQEPTDRRVDWTFASFDHRPHLGQLWDAGEPVPSAWSRHRTDEFGPSENVHELSNAVLGNPSATGDFVGAGPSARQRRQVRQHSYRVLYTAGRDQFHGVTSSLSRRAHSRICLQPPPSLHCPRCKIEAELNTPSPTYARHSFAASDQGWLELRTGRFRARRNSKRDRQWRGTGAEVPYGINATSKSPSKGLLTHRCLGRSR